MSEEFKHLNLTNNDFGADCWRKEVEEEFIRQIEERGLDMAEFLKQLMHDKKGDIEFTFPEKLLPSSYIPADGFKIDGFTAPSITITKILEEKEKLNFKLFHGELYQSVNVKDKAEFTKMMIDGIVFYLIEDLKKNVETSMYYDKNRIDCPFVYSIKNLKDSSDFYLNDLKSGWEQFNSKHLYIKADLKSLFKDHPFGILCKVSDVKEELDKSDEFSLIKHDKLLNAFYSEYTDSNNITYKLYPRYFVPASKEEIEKFLIKGN